MAEEYSIQFNTAFAIKRGNNYVLYQRVSGVKESHSYWEARLQMSVKEVGEHMLNRLIRRRTAIGDVERVEILQNYENLRYVVGVNVQGINDFYHSSLSELLDQFKSENPLGRTMLIILWFVKL